ncbi:hypothetical protein [Nonomuraea sp. NPDC046570]|uniref:hypothetical protein n=1 Tax=Nonomuraea sp. NPDC046570 TaxID=3155255 RepID=UPI003400D567
MSGAERATMIVTGTTTMGILEVAPISSGDVVLVMSAAGGIGRLLVQPGWDKPVEERFGPVTVVYDGVGGDRGRAAFGLLDTGGRHIVYGSASRQDFTPDPGALAAREVTSTYALAPLKSWPGGCASSRPGP